MSDDYRLLLDINNYVCTGIFILEAFIKLSAVGWKCYFYDRYEGFQPYCNSKTALCLFAKQLFMSSIH